MASKLSLLFLSNLPNQQQRVKAAPSHPSSQLLSPPRQVKYMAQPRNKTVQYLKLGLRKSMRTEIGNVGTGK